MRYVLSGPLNEYKNKRHTDKTRTKLTETTLITPASFHTNKKSIKTRCNISFEAIVFENRSLDTYDTLAAGLHQVT